MSQPSPSTPKGLRRYLGSTSPLALLLLLNNGILFGLFFSINRVAMTECVPLGAYMTWQGLGSAILLLAFGAIFGGLPGFSAAHIKGYIAIAIPGFIVSWGMAAFIAPKIPAGIFAIVNSLIPIITYCLVLTARLERFHRVRMIGLLLGLGSVLLLMLPETSLPEREMAIWVLVSVIGPAALALSTVLMVTLRPAGSSSAGMGAGVMLAAGLIALPIMVAMGDWWFFDGPWGTGHWAMIGAIVVTAALWGFAFEIVRLVGPLLFTFVDYIAMLTGIGWGILIFGEAHSGWVWGAVGLMLVAIYLVSKTGDAARLDTER
jgi:drug/metabolite transporter (DMT)-like permease